MIEKFFIGNFFGFLFISWIYRYCRCEIKFIWRFYRFKLLFLGKEYFIMKVGKCIKWCKGFNKWYNDILYVKISWEINIYDKFEFNIIVWFLVYVIMYFFFFGGS